MADHGRPTRRAFLRAAGTGAVVLTAAACANSPVSRPGPNGAGAPAAPAAVPMPTAAVEVMRAPRYAASRWFVHVADRATGEEIVGLDAGELVLPAGTAKLWSTAAALDAFGPDFRFETPVYRRGNLDGAVLRGDLVLVAAGDLTMGGRDTPQGTLASTDVDHAAADPIDDGATLTTTDPLAGLDDLARQIAGAGITQVTGNVLVDVRMFDQTTQGDHVLSPIMINDNLVDLTLAPGAVGAAATVTTRPVTTAYTVSSAVTTTAADQPAAVTVTTRGGAITVAGSIPAGPPVVRTEPVTDPQSFARTLFIEALGRAGVAVTAQATGPNPVDALPAAGSYPTTDRVALHRSLPFAENIKLINKADLDAQADTLIMLIAAKNGKKTFDDGMALLAPFVRTAGVDPASMSLADGSGSSDADRFTPRTVGVLLRHQATRADFPAYLASLPVPGASGQTTAGPAAGRIAAKTGTMIADDPLNGRAVLRTSGSAGYMTSRSGRGTVVAVYVMNTPIAEDADALAVLADVGSVVVALWDAT